MIVIFFAVVTAFLPSPHVGAHDPLPYEHPEASCYGTYQRMTDDVEMARRRYDYPMATRLAIEAARTIASCLKASATPEQRMRYRYSAGRSLWTAGEDAYAAGQRERACALVFDGWRTLRAAEKNERDAKRREHGDDLIDRARADLRGNWLSWWVPGGIRTPVRNDRACRQNVAGNPTRQWFLFAHHHADHAARD